MKKRGQLSINIVVIATLAIIVLVILLVVFRGKIMVFSKGAGGMCEQQGGECGSDITSCGEGDYRIFAKCGATEDERACCIPLEGG